MDLRISLQPTTTPSLLVALCVVALTGCQAIRPHCDAPFPITDLPRELDKATLPLYRVEPPDILTIDVVQQVAESSYVLHEGDTVLMTVLGTFPDETIDGIYPIETGGVIRLGYGYGSVQVSGLHIEDARQLIETHLRKTLRDPQVSMALRDVRGMQRIAGEHLVGPDGTITLGRYGSVPVVGMTLEEVRHAIADHLSPHFAKPEVSVSVYAFNSKVYYIVTQGGGLGDGLVRLPYTGNETVMDAISHINGLAPVSSTRMWVARPGRNHAGSNQILAVDWAAITQRGEVDTNYQLLPGDRLYVAEDKWIAVDESLAKLTSPLERVLGFTLLGTATASRLSGKVLDNRNNLLFQTR